MKSSTMTMLLSSIFQHNYFDLNMSINLYWKSLHRVEAFIDSNSQITNDDIIILFIFSVRKHA